jgi:hypothetical protein
MLGDGSACHNRQEQKQQQPEQQKERRHFSQQLPSHFESFHLNNTPPRIEYTRLYSA